MPIETKAKGLLETQRAIEKTAAALFGDPFIDDMKDAVGLVQRDARILAPVDRGTLRNSITTSINRSGRTVQGLVGSKLAYAPYMELGTGTFAGKSAYFPPSGALNLWARRHGFSSGWMVAYAIYMRGGLEPRRFLQQAFDKNQVQIKIILSRSVADIISKYGGSVP